MNATPLFLARTAAPLLAWAVAFALTAILAGRSLPPLELPSTVREKSAHLAAHGDGYDAIFIGTSRLQNHVMPAVFDPLVTAGGLPMKSFNAAIASMRPPEDAWFLDHILSRKPARLRWVFLEADYFNTELQDDQKGTLRGIYWHDWPRFRQLCRRLLVMKSGLGFRDKIADTFERLSDFIDHLSAFGQLHTHQGRGLDTVDRWRHKIPPAPLDEKKLGENGDGWIPSKRPELRDEKALARLAQLAGDGKDTAPKPQQSNRVGQALLAENIAKIRRSGATPILVIPPRTRANYFVPSAENARHAALIDLCDPVRYAELYDRRYRIDTSHLNPAGAEVLTRILAARFLEIAAPSPR